MVNRLICTIVLCCTFLPSLVWSGEPSFSFLYDGQKVTADQLNFQTDVSVSTGTRDWCQKSGTTADGKLQVILSITRYKNFPVTEYGLKLKNLSSTETTGLVSDFQSLDTAFPISGSAEIRSLFGSHCTVEDFRPVVDKLEAGQSKELVNGSGRSSNEWMPFWEVNTDAQNGHMVAVAWTGGWKAQMTNSGSEVTVKAGMLRTNFRLNPGETLSQPGIAIFERQNQSRTAFQTWLHRFMVDVKAPRDSKGNVIPPIIALASGGGNKTPQMMQDILKYALDNKLPFDTYWVDAGWYGAPHEDELYSNCGPNWAGFAGDWRINTVTHPTGTLLPIADAVHAAGMKFLLWFEPERAENVPVRAEHPEWFHRNLLDYGNPDALKYIQDTIYGIIDKHGINVYREDFNMDPAGIWAEADTNPERVGVTEIKHIEGLYAFLDGMRKRFPDILQENCASGGRRIDIEMVSRAHSYCRSDFFIGQKPDDQTFILGQNATRNTLAMLPFQGCEFNCVPVGDDYGALSIISSGVVITPSDFDGGVIRRQFADEETRWFKKTFDLAARMKPYWLGDFYPLTEDETPASNDVWCGWQMATGDSGFALVFRRANAAEESKMLTLGAIDPNAEYEVENFAGETKTLSGKELQTWTVSIPQRSFELIFYKKK